jgi:predicted nuclease of predicted toxin-antitoxin system
MRFLVDMNLSPRWVDYLNESAHDAVHWSSVGRPDAKDREIMDWARENDRIVLTNDPDFGALLALSGSSKPSVVQIRSEATLPSRIGTLVLEASEQAESDLLAGALLTVEIGQSRLRILPLDPER